MNFFVEGLQGSGKSTLVNKLSEKLPEYQVFREGDYSPAELAWCAYVTEEQLQKILEKYPEYREKILEKTVSEGDHRIVCYTKVREVPRDFYQELEQYEIYNGRVDFDTFQSIILGRYQAWTGDRMIFECSLFQNTVEDMILFRNAEDEEIMALYRRIREALEGREIHIVYLKAEDVEANINVIRKERSDENGRELWFPMLCDFFDHSLYAEVHGVSGEEALMEHLKHRQALEIRILKEIFPERHTILASKQYTEHDIEDVIRKGR